MIYRRNLSEPLQLLRTSLQPYIPLPLKLLVPLVVHARRLLNSVTQYCQI